MVATSLLDIGWISQDISLPDPRRSLRPQACLPIAAPVTRSSSVYAPHTTTRCSCCRCSAEEKKSRSDGVRKQVRAKEREDHKLGKPQHVLIVVVQYD